MTVKTKYPPTPAPTLRRPIAYQTLEVITAPVCMMVVRPVWQCGPTTCGSMGCFSLLSHPFFFPFFLSLFLYFLFSSFLPHPRVVIAFMCKGQRSSSGTSLRSYPLCVCQGSQGWLEFTAG